MAKTAAKYDSLWSIRETAWRSMLKTVGWAEGRLYEVYPGGRAIDWTRIIRGCGIIEPSEQKRDK
jgi:hypothetical protein